MRSVIFTEYTVEQREKLCAILCRTLGTGEPDMEAVVNELTDALYATGVAHDGSEWSLLWNEAEAAEPGPGELAELHRDAAQADEPVATAHDDLRLTISLTCFLRMRSLQHRKGPEAALAPDEVSEFRAYLLKQADGYQSQVRRGIPEQFQLDELLGMIGEIFLRHGGDDRTAVEALPHSSTSRFIQFAAAAMAPLEGTWTVSAKALSRRWGRARMGAFGQIFHSPRAAQEFIERLRWQRRITCPFCGADGPHERLHAKAYEYGKRLCASCSKTFTPLDRTVFGRFDRSPDLWMRLLRRILERHEIPSDDEIAEILGDVGKSKDTTGISAYFSLAINNSDLLTRPFSDAASGKEVGNRRLNLHDDGDQALFEDLVKAVLSLTDRAMALKPDDASAP